MSSSMNRSRGAVHTPTSALRLPTIPIGSASPTRDGLLSTPSVRTVTSNNHRSHRMPVSEELSGIVLRNQAAQAAAAETKAAVKYVATENEMMEEVLREKHRMLTNSDLALIVGSVMTKADGTKNSSILQSRKPPVLMCKQRALGALAPPVAFERERQRSTGKPNFAVLCEQQREMMDKVVESRQTYDRMIAEFMTKQQSLSERFANILS